MNAKVNMNMIEIPQGDPRSLWPSIVYTVVPQNLFMETSLEDPEIFINFLATRESHMNKTHLKYDNMRECVWEREYRSSLTGPALEQYKNVFTHDWHRVATAKTLSEKWDSFWERREGSMNGTLIFARSANSQVLCEVDVRFSEDGVTMHTEKLRVSIETEYDEEYDKRMANWLLMTKFWSIPFYPFPRTSGDNVMGFLTEFLMGGGLESVIVSHAEPDIVDVHNIERRCNELIGEPYVRLIVSHLVSRGQAAKNI